MRINSLFSRRNEYALVLAMLFAVPLLFDLRLFNAFILPKKTVFDGLFLLLILSWSARAYLSGRFAWYKNSFFNGLVALFFSAELLSVIFSVSSELAWFGSALRLSGSMMSLQLFAVGLWVALHYDYIKERLHWLAMTVAASGGAVSLYGLMQALGLDPLNWQVFEGVFVRASSTLGQPNFFASYLLGAMAVTGLGFCQVKQRRARWAYLAVLSMEFFALIYSLSRGAWLGLLGAGLIMLLLYLYKAQRKYFWVAGAIAGSLIVAFLILGSSGMIAASDQPGRSNLQKRVVSLLDFREGSIRGHYYRAAIELIIKRPFVGYGRDSLGSQFSPYYSPDWSIYEVLNQGTDRAHNFWLDLWLQVGLLGVIFWVGLLYFIFRAIYGDLWSRPVAICSLTGLLAILISWQFGFETLEPALFAWLFIGLLIGEAGLAKKEIKLSLIEPFLVGSIFFFFCFLGLLSDFNRVKVSRLYRQLLVGRDVAGDITLVKQILSQATVSDLKNFYGAHLYSLIDDKIKFQRIGRADLELMVGSLDDLQGEPAIFEYRQHRLVFMTNLSQELFWQGGGAGLAQQLENGYAELKKSARNYAVIELGWGNLLYYQHKCDQALGHYREALALYPDLENPRINREHRGYIEAERNQVLGRIAACEGERKNEIIKKDSRVKSKE